MNNRLTQIFRLESDEAGLVIALGLLLFSNSIAQQIAEIVSISGFLSEGGVNQVPVIWLIVMSLIILITGLKSLIVDRFKRLKLMGGMVLGLAMFYGLLRLMFTFSVAGWIIYGAMNILAELQWLFFSLIFWILANDLLSLAQAKRLFPLIASWGFVGELVGIGITAAAPSLFNQLGIKIPDLLLLNVAIYLVILLVITSWLRRYEVRPTRQKPETMRETLVEGWGFVREVPAFRYLTLAIVAINLCLTVIEFRFLVVTDSFFNTLVSYQRFFSLYRLGITLASFVFLSLVTGRLIKKISLKNSFLVMPVALLLGIFWMAGLPGIISGIGGMVIPKLSQKGVDEPVRKAFQALVPEERRGRVSLFMDSYMFAAGTIIGSLLILAIVFGGRLLGTEGYFYLYLGAGLLGAALAGWATVKIRTVYDSSMLNWRLKRRQRKGLTGVLNKLDF